MNKNKKLSKFYNKEHNFNKLKNCKQIDNFREGFSFAYR